MHTYVGKRCKYKHIIGWIGRWLELETTWENKERHVLKLKSVIKIDASADIGYVNMNI